MRLLSLAALLLAGCLDTTKCKMPSSWTPCAGQTAQPGASGTPPAITSLSLPTCAYVENPMVAGPIHVVDPDADTMTLKASFYIGQRVNEVDVPVPFNDAASADWIDTVAIKVVESGGGGKLSEGTREVRLKITDKAGNQSVPYCGSLSLIN